MVEGFVNVPLMFKAFVPDAPPVIPPVTVGADQLYNVPGGTIPFVPLVGVTVKLTPLQVAAVIAVITADGFTLTVSVKLLEAPQLIVVGVTV